MNVILLVLGGIVILGAAVGIFLFGVQVGLMLARDILIGENGRNED